MAEPAAVLEAGPARWRPLTGGNAVWLFMGVEVLTFGMFLLLHAWGWSGREEVYAASQARLHVDAAVLGTVILLVGSGFVYQGVLAIGEGRARAAAGWLAATALTGVLFTANKLAEYASPSLADISLSTNGFWFSYLFVTGLHLAHVVGGVAILGWLALRLGRADTPGGGADRLGPDTALHVEAAAAYWHLVDVTWLLVFPILYLMHP